MTGPTRLRYAVAILLLAVFTSCNPDRPAPTGVASDIRSSAATLAPLASIQGAIPDRYIVVLRDDVADVAAMSQSIVSTHGGKVHYNYRYALKGFAATLSRAAVDALRRDPLVALVAEDGMAYPSIDQPNPPSWGLDRIDQRPLPLNAHYIYSKTGAGVSVYIIDTGILTTHNEFGGRAVVGADFVGDGRNGQDCNGHGTHVSGTVAGTTFGVAKGARVIAVRVFACSGGSAWSTIIAAVDWVTADVNRPAGDPKKVGGLPAVANMSLGGAFSAPVNTAVQNLINARVVTVVAAGNESKNACLVSPASAPAAITVGATRMDDTQSWFSNFGSCVDLFAPGESITSAWIPTNTSTATISGTSMATPHVVGVAALYLQGKPATTLPATVANAILNSATPNRLSLLGSGSPNLLLYSPLTASSASFSLNPAALSFTFVRAPAALASVASPKPSAAPIFKASGTGMPSYVKTSANGTVHATAISTTASSTIQLTNFKSALREWEASDNSTWLSVTPTDGALPARSSTLLTASVNSSALALGTHTGSINVRDVTPAVPVSHTVPVTVTVAAVTPLLSGVPQTGIAGATNTFKYFMLSLSTGAKSLKITFGSTVGVAALYVRYEQVPDPSNFDCISYVAGGEDICAADFPPAGTYYVMLQGIAPYSGGTLTATVVGLPPAAPTTLTPTVVSSTQINLAWTDASTDETQFNLYRRTRNVDLTFGPWAVVVSRPANTTSYNNTGLTAATSYQYRIRACNSAGCSAYKTSTVATTLP